MRFRSKSDLVGNGDSRIGERCGLASHHPPSAARCHRSQSRCHRCGFREDAPPRGAGGSTGRRQENQRNLPSSRIGSASRRAPLVPVSSAASVFGRGHAASRARMGRQERAHAEPPHRHRLPFRTAFSPPLKLNAGVVAYILKAQFYVTGCNSFTVSLWHECHNVTVSLMDTHFDNWLMRHVSECNISGCRIR